jgi:hypothetical protein
VQIICRHRNRLSRSTHSGGLAEVVSDDTTKPLLASHLAAYGRENLGWIPGLCRSVEPDPRVRSLPVAVIGKLEYEVVQVSGPEHDELIEALGGWPASELRVALLWLCTAMKERTT